MDGPLHQLTTVLFDVVVVVVVEVDSNVLATSEKKPSQIKEKVFRTLVNMQVIFNSYVLIQKL